MDTQQIAKICHDANRSYCQTIGDFTQKNWENAPDWQKESAIKGVEFILSNPTATPEDSHKSWLEVKEAEGWKYGPVKDVEKKEHPCCVPYHGLPEAQRRKDALFGSIVRALAGIKLMVAETPSEPEPLKANDYEFLATFENRILKPVINADTEAEAREKFISGTPQATIHKITQL